MNTRLLSYNVPAHSIKKTSLEVEKKLKDMGYKPTLTAYIPHISIAQIKDKYPISELENAQIEGKKYNPEFKFEKIEYLEGRENLDFIVIKLTPNSSFNQYLNYITNKFETIQYPGGFKFHVSLMTLPKKEMKEEDKQELKKMSLSGSLKPTKIQLWNTEKQMVKEIAAKRILMKKGKEENSYADLLDLEHKVYGSTSPVNVVSMENKRITASTSKDQEYLADKIITARDILASNAKSQEKLKSLSLIIADLEKLVS
jgi:hypothetical protein